MAGSVRLTRASSQYLSRATVPDYNADYTAAGWFIPRSMPGWQGVFTLFGVGDNLDWLIVKVDNNKLLAGRAKLGVFTDTEASSPVLVADTPYFAAYVASGTGYSLYVGTSASAVALITTVTHDPAGRSAATTLRIGNSPYGDLADGEFGGWRVYTRALTLAELKVEAAVPTAVVSTNLWGDWTLPDASTLTDGSGNGRTLTATNGPLTTGSVPPYIFSGTGALAAGTITTAATAAETFTGTGALAAGGAVAAGSGTFTSAATVNIHRRRGKLLGRGCR